MDIYSLIHILDIFRKYFEDHGEKFVDAPEMCGGEHNMEYYSLFQDYLVVYEVHIYIYTYIHMRYHT
jgi:hypothetical protein